MKADLEEVYEADGAKKLKPHLAAVNRPHVVNDTPGAQALRVPMIELIPMETLAILLPKETSDLLKFGGSL